MIKPESNAPASMKPWVRTTDKQIEELETAVSKITNALNAGNSSIDHEQNQSLSNTFSFTPLDDGSTVTNSQAMNFTGAITSESDVSIAGSLVVGDPSRQEYDPLSGEAVGSIPNLEVISGQLEINPITELEYYTTGEFNVTDTSFNVDGYGLIHGDGLQITLANDGQAERQNIQILGASGTGTDETFQIENNASNVAIYTAGRYVNITGVDPAGYNGTNLLVTSVNTGVSPMTFTVTGTETATWVAGGYATINDANSIYEGKLTVQGPAPDYTGVTIEQDGVFIGTNGGDPNIAVARLDSTGLTAPSAFIDQAVINGTRLFISSTAPTAVNDGDIWIDKTGIFTQGGGSVTSIGMTVPTGLTITPSAITTSGTFAIGLQSGYSIPDTLSQGYWTTAYNERAQWDGGSTNLVAGTGRTSLGATTVGSNFFTLTNPSVLSWPRINADNTVTARSAANTRADLGASTVGDNFFTLSSPSAITFPRINADNTVSALDAATFRTAIGIGSGFSGAGTSVTGVQSAAGVALPISTSTVSTGNSGAISVITGTVTGSPGVTGAVTVATGDATSSGADSGAVLIKSGAGSGSSGSSGSVTIDAGVKSGSGTVGIVGIGTSNATTTNIGTSGATPAVARYTNIGGAYGTTASGAFSHAVNLGNWYAISSGGTSTINLGGGFSNGGTSAINIGSWTNSTGTQTIGIGTSNGTSTTTLNGTTTHTGSTNLAAGTTAINPLKFTANASTPTLTAGVVDFDGNAFFATPKVNNTTAGKGLIPTQQYFIPNANTTIVTSTGSIGTFTGNAMGNKSIYLAASTTYEVEAVLYVQHTWSATTTNNFTINLLYPTGSTALLNMVSSYATSTSVSGTGNQAALNSTTAVVISASPTSGNWFRVVLKGIIKTSTTAGNFSPVFGYTTTSGSTTATNTIGANSFIKVNPVGGVGADINIGGWA